MPHPGSVRLLVLAAAVALGGFALRGPSGAGEQDFAQQVEDDWLTQDRLRGDPLSGVTLALDAAGAVDGVKEGKWGFHTGPEADPWWQVDLGAPTALGRALLFNRCETPDRTAALRLLLSDDGQAWTEAYRNNGVLFYGFTDGKPLAVDLSGKTARYLRLQQPGGFLNLDEVEVYAAADPARNVALGRPCTQSSLSQWSVAHSMPRTGNMPMALVVRRGRALCTDLAGMGVDVRPYMSELRAAEAAYKAPGADRKAAYLRARWAVRRAALANPLLSFNRIVFVKRKLGTFSHMSDQNYGWWSRPGGGICLLEGFRTGAPRVRTLTTSLPEGSCLDPELSADGKRVLFAWCRYHPELSTTADKTDKARLPEDGFYHLYEVGIDGTGLRKLTSGKHDDFSGRYLPDGRVAFLSTRRGNTLAAGSTCVPVGANSENPDGYVRCGGDNYRPVPVYTLHVLDKQQATVRAISPFESFEWTPSVAPDGRILYARWDYVDRDNMPYMKLWSTNADGTQAQIVWGNYTTRPHCAFEARVIPGTRKIVFTASAHHATTGGAIDILDPGLGADGQEPITNITPEVAYPEINGWPRHYYASPWPLSDRYFLVAWSREGLMGQGGMPPEAGMGVYLYDIHGNLELLYRDPSISSLSPIPVRPSRSPAGISAMVAKRPTEEGAMLISDVYHGLTGVRRGSIKSVRVVAMPTKTQPHMNTPTIGQTSDDPGKCVLGTAPVEADGSAHFSLPANVPVFLQALDDEGMAVQTMRSLTYVQAGRTAACGGCHEPRTRTARNLRPRAASRPPSRLIAGPEGTWPMDYSRLVQPMLDTRCGSCHQPGSSGARFDLTAGRSYNSLVQYGQPSLRDVVTSTYRRGRSLPGQGPAHTSALLQFLGRDAAHQRLLANPEDRRRLIVWMDTYAQRQGHFSPAQEEELKALKARWAGIARP